MNYDIYQFPVELKKILSRFQQVNITEGRLNDQIQKYEDEQNKVVYLKCGKGAAAASLESEVQTLSWFKNKNVNVPKVLFSAKNNNTFFLLISEVEGKPAHKATSYLSKGEVLKIVAEALFTLHHLNIKRAENLNTLDKDLREISGYVAKGCISRDNFMANNQGQTPEEVLKILYDQKNSHDNNVLTHGDYCLPNVMISEKSFGFIDLGKCGLGDKYKDFSAMEVSIRRNFGSEWIGKFYKYYDEDLIVNQEKIRYYQMIDQFNYNLDTSKVILLGNS